MEAFSFYNPTRIHFGQGMINRLGPELSEDGIKHVLLVAGGGSIRNNGVYDQVRASLSASDIQTTEAWGVQANPTLAKVQEMISIARESKVDAILAVGGGSVIDSAKAVAAGVYLNDVWAAFTGNEKVSRALPLYTVLTISATGSEMNGNAVITNTETKQKWSFVSPFVYPKTTFIDPTVQGSLPFKQTASGAMDAMAHILEFYFVDSKAIITVAIDDAILKTIVEMTDRLHQNPVDIIARSNLAWCATLALNGLSGVGMKGGDWACHQIEHAISAIHPHIAHGEGLSAIFPAWIEYMNDRDTAPFMHWARSVWNEDNVSRAVQRFRDKLASWGLATSIRDLGVKESDLSEIMRLITMHARIGGISKFTKVDIEALLMLAY